MADARADNPAGRVIVLSADAPVRAGAAGEVAGAECVAVQSAYEAAAELVASDTGQTPALALVVDLRLMSPRHLRLLQIARERGVEVLAVGGIPAGLTAEDLSGVRLVARAELKAALERLVAARPAVSPAEPPAALGAEPVALGEPRRPFEEGLYVSDEAAAFGGPRSSPAASSPERPAAGPVERHAAGQVERPAHGRRSAKPAAGAPAPAKTGPPPAAPERPAVSGVERPAANGVERPAVSGSGSLTAGGAERPAASPAASPPPRSILTKEELAALLEDEP